MEPLGVAERLLSSAPVGTVDAAGVRLAAAVQGHRALDRAMYALSEVANHSALWHGINALDALTGDGPRRRRALRRSALLAAEQALVNGPLKASVRRGRPEPRDDHPHELRTPLTSSFPSGHASAGACAATLLTRDLGHGPLWWGLASVVAWSRVHVGVHHTSDVAAGAAVGTLLAVVGGRIWPPAPGAATAGTTPSDAGTTTSATGVAQR